MHKLADMHMHVGFAGDAPAFARELDELGIAVFSNTVTPGEYLQQKSATRAFPRIQTGLGLHPWWIGTKRLESVAKAIDAFESELAGTSFVGEVGLDFLPSHEATREEQIAVFTRIAHLCAAKGGCLVSLHATRAEREAIDILEESACLDTCNCIFHSYGGPSDQLKRAVNLGCLFSIGERMLATKKGREYARILPDDSILLETDLPDRANAQCDANAIASSLLATLTELSRIRSCDRGELASAIAERSFTLLDL